MCENLAWLDPKQYAGDHLLAGWKARADRVLILGIGADGYSLQPNGSAPGAMSMVLAWNLKPGENREGWIVRPYHGYAADLPTLRKHDWAAEMAEGKKEWQTLLAKFAETRCPRYRSDQRISGMFLRFVHHARTVQRRARRRGAGYGDLSGG